MPPVTLLSEQTFIEIATKYPAAALQRFGQVRTPSPPWVALHRVTISQRSLSSAADYLVDAFGGPEMAYKIAGGSKWWQVRAGQGLEAEWIVMKKDWKEYTKRAAEGKEGGGEYKQRTAADGMVGEDGGVKEDGQCGWYRQAEGEKSDERSPRRDGRAALYAVQ